MKKTALTALTFAAAGVLLLHSPNVSAQDAPPPPPPGAQGGPGSQDGADRMAQFRARMEERVKTSLKASDDEWAVIQPLLDKVESKQREALMSRYSSFMGGGYRGPRSDSSSSGSGSSGRSNRSDRGPRGGSPEAQALNDALQNDNASVDEIKTKLAALREQRKKSAAELTQAREDLKKVLNMHQEATLVAMGILD